MRFLRVQPHLRRIARLCLLLAKGWYKTLSFKF
jgi:hypothetical protein